MLFERLLITLRGEKSNLEQRIALGQIEDFAEYKFLAGQVRGLTNAVDICKEIFKGYEDEESK